MPKPPKRRPFPRPIIRPVGRPIGAGRHRTTILEERAEKLRRRLTLRLPSREQWKKELLNRLKRGESLAGLRRGRTNPPCANCGHTRKSHRNVRVFPKKGAFKGRWGDCSVARCKCSRYVGGIPPQPKSDIVIALFQHAGIKSIAELARRAGMAEVHLSRVLKGRRGISLKKARSLAGALRVSLDVLFEVLYPQEMRDKLGLEPPAVVKGEVWRGIETWA